MPGLASVEVPLPRLSFPAFELAEGAAKLAVVAFFAWLGIVSLPPPRKLENMYLTFSS